MTFYTVKYFCFSEFSISNTLYVNRKMSKIKLFKMKNCHRVCLQMADWIRVLTEKTGQTWIIYFNIRF